MSTSTYQKLDRGKSWSDFQYLLNSQVYVKGKVQRFGMRLYKAGPKAGAELRPTILLQPVWIADIPFDHLWIDYVVSLKNVSEGDWLHMTANLKSYTDSGGHQKLGVKKCRLTRAR